MEEYAAPNSTSADAPKQPEGMTEQQIVDRVSRLKKSYEQATVDSRKEFQEIFAVYSGKTNEIQSTPYNTQDDIPKLRTEIAYVKPFIFSGEPVVEFEGIGDEDKAIAKIYEKIVNHRFNTIPGFYDKIESWVGQSTGFGTSEVKVIWRFQTQKEQGQGPDGQPYEYETPILDAPDIEVPNHMDVYFNPIVPEVKDQECIIFRSVLSLKEVKENPIYDYKNMDGQRNADTLEESGSQADQYNSSILANTDIPSAQQKSTTGMVEVWELIDNDRIQTVANGKVLRDVENPYGFKNVVKLIFEPSIIPNRYEGYGVGQNTQALGKMFYKLFNQLSTNVKMTNNPMFMTKKGSVKDKRQLVSKPGGAIEVEGDGPLSDSIVPVQFSDVTTSAFEILNKVDDEHKRASGASDLVQGSASNETLGQDEIAQGNISNRFELIVRRFKNALAQVADMMLKMELQNLQSPEAEILRIFPEEMRAQIYEVLISEKDSVKYNVKIKGETNVARNKNLESKRLVELYQLMSPFLQDREKRAFGRRIAEMQGIDNVDEIIQETNPLMEQQEEMQMQMNDQQMMMGQMGMPPEASGSMQQSGMGDNLNQQAVA